MVGAESNAICREVSTYAAVAPFAGTSVPAATVDEDEEDWLLAELLLAALLLAALLDAELALELVPPLEVFVELSELSEDDPPPHAARRPASANAPTKAGIRYNIMILLLFYPVSRTGLLSRLSRGQFAFTPEHQFH